MAGFIIFFAFLTIFVVDARNLAARKWVKQTAISVAVGFSLGLENVKAAIDCNGDCFSNCARVAPGSNEYCKSLCSEYCDQPDRQDGLSGSIDATRGETGIFGGSIDGTVTRGQDKPPSIQILPKGMLDLKTLMRNGGVKE